jgi:two-component system OmpR family response regulator
MLEPSVLIVEDDHELRGLLARALSEEGFSPITADSGSAALTQIERDAPDLLLLDVGLPDSDGRDVCQALRARGCRAPVLFLTARDALTDCISGFDAGGDDYMTKPFALVEVVVRLRALMRRANGSAEAAGPGLRLDPAAHALRRGERQVPLTPTEFRILAALAGQPGAIVRRGELVRAAWPDGAIVHDNTLDVYLARVRRKLRELEDGSRIETAHGVGYRLVVDESS